MPSPPPHARSVLGARAEEAVSFHLERSGLAILGRNVRVGRLELDIVAREGEVIAIVEVRVRGPGALVRALDSIDAGKQKRVRAAGESLWRTQFSKDPTLARMRFDAAGVSFDEDGEPVIELVKAAF